MASDGEALLRAVCESPADDLPRLVFADWLEENGRPERAEFIRLQCEDQAAVERFPSLWAARARAGALLRAHRQEWLAELPGLPEVEWGGLWVRGFIDAATVEPRDDPRGVLDAVFDATPVVRLAMTGIRPGVLRAVLDYPRLGRLRSLSLFPRRRSSGEDLVVAARRRFPGTHITWHPPVR